MPILLNLKVNRLGVMFVFFSLFFFYIFLWYWAFSSTNYAKRTRTRNKTPIAASIMRGKTHTPKPVSFILLLIGRVAAKHAFLPLVGRKNL